MALTIGDLLEGRDKPLSVRPTDRLNFAVDQMLRHDYTQLPVTSEADKLIGVVTSDSILSAVEAFGLATAQMTVADAMKKARSFDPDADVADLLNALRDDYAALVVDGEGRLYGIITGFDASEYFRRRSEDIMLVEDIESSVKEHVLAAFQDSDGKTDHAKLAEVIARVADPNKSLKGRVTAALKHYLVNTSGTAELNAETLDRAVQDTCAATKLPTFDDLTLNAYVDLLLHTSVWVTYSDVFGMEADALRRLLENIRNTRNALAHFRGEISATERERLRFCAAWLDRHPPRRTTVQPPVAVVTIPSTNADASEPEIVPVDDDIEPGESRYVKLAVWLQKAAPIQDSVPLTFNQVEEILGGALPASAREHRSWWANDSVSHPQSRRWLEVGWRVANVSLADEIVTYSRVEERESAYIKFFSRLLARLEHLQGFPLRSFSPSGINWHTFARLPDSGWILGLLVCSFARGDRLRVEFYIDAKDKNINKSAFDKLTSVRADIEGAFGGQLFWERLDERRASRIAVYKSGSIMSKDSELDELVGWAADALDRLYQALTGPVSGLVSSAPGMSPEVGATRSGGV